MTTETLERSSILRWFINRIRSNAHHRLLGRLTRNAKWVADAQTAPTVASLTEKLAREDALARAGITRR
jgi:hypothetical protein